jgi:hypothetical protein
MATGYYFVSETCFGLAGTLLVLWALAQKWRLSLRSFLAVLFAGGTSFFIWIVDEARLEKFLSANPADIVADTKPSPIGACPNRGDNKAVNLFLGATAFGNSRLPFVALKIGGKKIIDLDTDEHNNLYVTLDIRAADGTLLTRVIKNKITINKSFTFQMERDDVHSFVVFDSKGYEVLNISYLNRNAIQITGDFYAEDARIVIDKEGPEVFFKGGHRASFKNIAMCGWSVGLQFQ